MHQMLLLSLQLVHVPSLAGYCVVIVSPEFTGVALLPTFSIFRSRNASKRQKHLQSSQIF